MAITVTDAVVETVNATAATSATINLSDAVTHRQMGVCLYITG
jgi:hypothetical protein